MNKIDEIAFTTKHLRDSRMFNKPHKYVIDDGMTRQVVISYSASLAITQFLCFTDEGKFAHIHIECRDLGEWNEDLDYDAGGYDKC